MLYFIIYNLFNADLVQFIAMLIFGKTKISALNCNIWLVFLTEEIISKIYFIQKITIVNFEK